MNRQRKLRTQPAVALVLMAPIAVTLALLLAYDPVAGEANKPLIHRQGGYVGSMQCKICHPDQHSSWARTFHSTMTQRPEPERVKGDFDAEPQPILGKAARLEQQGGDFFMEIPAGPEGPRRARVSLLVGSNRYQQYFERVERNGGFVYRRLPMLWHIEGKKWKHMSEVFLGPDQSNWDSHAAIWNENCIYCHNTGPQPRFLNYDKAPDADHRSFDSEVGEMGIACEACHGPGKAHLAAVDGLPARIGAQLGSNKDLAIVNPDRLPKEEATAVCGQCHGQRLPKDLGSIAAWVDKGPSFRPGDRLEAHVIPMRSDTRFPGTNEPASIRFWGDGTPRLSAYEYQGVTTSPCYLKGPMHCGSCHTMHSGSVHGNLPEAKRGNAACTGCHEEIARDVPAHTHHEAGSSGSHCMECHMPRIVYGVLDLHRSHRIELPIASRDAAAGRPHACTLCHLDKSLRWAGTETNRLWNRKDALPTKRKDKANIDLADGIASLHAGDAVQRVVYAKAFSRRDGPLPANQRGFLRPHLMAMLNDAYPSLRHHAHESLLALEEEAPVGMKASIQAFDPSWRVGTIKQELERRKKLSIGLMQEFSTKARGKLAPPRADLLLDQNLLLDLPRVVALLKLQSRNIIDIGE